MSIAPYKSDPLTIPQIPNVAVPPSFWDDLITYRSPSMVQLTLQDRDRINRLTFDKATEIFASDLTTTRIETRGLDFALRKAGERAKSYKRYYVDCAVWDRDHSKATKRRVPCGARKKDGAQCRAMSEPGRNRCRFHGGCSTGPRTVEGMRKALSCLPQYRNDPERLEAKLSEWPKA
ncbi:hypothetical protein GCM10007853_30050 [Algimonas ampicilliniresistens]|uniref:Uncharacterized protein n=1 Tax=Algimonas ampicilliniresistens TaxID=1298735 RepID=A0ABQ5VEX1_9PROT|nr:HGGxSTG domain-containing protein [Algimonas ampicilliniresistens]GLQ25131.1 hypothetical protein GCM10007853_30050 [Algimonas ampicilliniresistens]